MVKVFRFLKVKTFHFFAFIYAKKLPLQANRYLVIAPHPDDEIFGCCGLLHRLIKMGKDVHIVIVTQGEAVHKKPLIPVSEIVAKRRELATSAGKIIGLTSEQYTFLDWGDSKIHEKQIYGNRPKELTSIIESFKPEIIFTTHPFEGGDHYHTTQIVSQTVRICSISIKIMYYCVWIWYRSLRLDWKNSYTLLMDKNEREIKSKAIDNYALPSDKFGMPYSGYLNKLPQFCRWRKELFFEVL